MGRASLEYIINYGGQPITDQPEATTLTEQPEDKAAESKPVRRGVRRARGFGLVALVAVLLPAAVVAILFVAFSGNPVVFPEWARDRVERLLDAQLANVDVHLDDVSLVIEDNWDPRVRVSGLELLPDGRGSGIRFDQVDLQLAMAPLTERQIAPRHLRIVGVSLSVLRGKDGAVDVSLGQGDGGVLGGEARFASLGEEIEAFLARPGLRHLQDVEIEDVALRYEDALSGRGWSIDGGSISLNRKADDVSISAQAALLGARGYATILEASLATSFDDGTVQVALKFEDAPSEELATQIAALSWLEVLRAPISGAVRARIGADGVLGPVDAALSASAGSLQPRDAVRPIPFKSLRSYLTYDPKSQRIGFDELSVDADLISASVSGQALLRDFEAGVPNTLLAQLTLNTFEANPNELNDETVALDRSYADFRLQLDPFDLELGQLVINQGDLQMSLQGALEAAEDGWAFALDGHMNEVQPERILSIWPERFKPKLRIWIDENIHAARLSDINLALRSRVAQPPDVYADFQFRDAVVKPVKTMPPVQGGRGFAVLMDHQFRVGVEGGYVVPDQGGTVDVSGSSFVVLNTRLKQSPARADVRAVASITAAASLLNRAPLNIFDNANLPVDVAQGRVEATGDLAFIMKDKLPVEEVKFDVTGRLKMVESTKLLPGKTLRGTLEVNANDQEVEIFGPGSIGAVPAVARWHAKLGKPGQSGSGESTVSGRVELSQSVVDEFNIGLPPGTLNGSSEADFALRFSKGAAPTLSLTSDMKDLAITAAPLGWRKPKGQAGALAVEMTLGKSPKVDRISVETSGLTAQGSIALKSDGGLDVIDIPNFKVGSWLSGAARLRGRGAAMPAVEMLGGRFDLGAMPNLGGGSGAGTGGGPITGRLDEVVIANNIVVSQTQFSLNSSGGINGTFAGLLGGTAPLTGKLGPHANGSAIEVTSSNAGAVVQAMGLVRQASGGNLLLRLEPRQATGVYDGVVDIEDIKIQSLPAFAELLNAVSVVGLLEQLNGPGLLFNDVHSVFKLAPGEIVIGEASAVGASMGLSADGRYLTQQGMLDIQGVLSPIYAVNVIGRPISKRGEGLIGFTYQLKGPVKDPVISVNPLSALTPGFFRGIFRRAPPDLSN
ncbi:hypothetical protein shim_10730 [Shimia sp. SK013]|nr:hypothetical protein shim_10730 [Shimia sp. SK013]